MAYLSFAQAQQSPCDNCSAPCCGSLPLHSFTITNYAEVDYARYLLNFSGIELIFLYEKTWQVQLNQDCSRFDNGRCTLHGTEEKPRICRKYSAYNCLYKPIFFQDENANFIRFNRERFDIWLNHLIFNEDRLIIGQPDIKELLPLLPEYKMEAKLPLPRMGVRRRSERRGYFEFQNSCTNCSAWCCKSLSFPFDGIQSRANLDYLWFVLGFPGVEVGISEQGWTIIVHTQCHNLEKNEKGFGCKLFGHPDRPLQCQDYDETTCAYKSHYELERDYPHQLSLDLSGFHTLASLYGFTEAGELLDFPSYGQIVSSFRK